MTGPTANNQDEPFDPNAYERQLLLLKSAHCARPILHRGLHQFINGLTLYHGIGRLEMTVYLTGITGGIDSKEIQIKPTKENT